MQASLDELRASRATQAQAGADPLVAEQYDRLEQSLASQAARHKATTYPSLIAEFERLELAAYAWVQRAKTAGLDAPVGPADAEAFVAWMTAISRHPELQVRICLSDNWSSAVRQGMEAAIRYCGDHPAAAALIPVDYFNRLRQDNALVRAEQHQLLGHCHASQEVQHNDNEVLLLQLFSDYGVEFMFCDVGEIHFWIDKDDLAARRFEDVRANTQGG